MAAPLISAKEVGTMLGLSPRSVYELANAGLLPCFRLGVGRGAVRFDPADVEAYKASCRSRPPARPHVLPTSTLIPLALHDADKELLAHFRSIGIEPKLGQPSEARPRPGKKRPGVPVVARAALEAGRPEPKPKEEWVPRVLRKASD